MSELSERERIGIGEINNLAKEIGAAPLGIVDGEAFAEEWCRRLAIVVEKYGWLPTYRYPDRVMGWCHSLRVAARGHMRLEMARIRKDISEIDYDDGWATDKAGSAVEHICLAMLPGTRWLAHAAQHIWAFAVGTGSYNDVVKFSRDAWLREQFTQTLLTLSSNERRV